VSIYSKPSGANGYICSNGNIDATTLSSRHRVGLDPWQCADEGEEYASPDRQLHVFVYVEWHYLNQKSWKRRQSECEMINI